MSDLQNISQHIVGLMMNAESAITQSRLYLRQINEMIALLNNIIKGTSQCEYQKLINQLNVSKLKLNYAIECLTSISKYGSDWLGEHVISSASTDTSISLTNMLNPKNSNISDELLKPTRQTPRDLSLTQYGFTTNESGMEVYDSPMKIDMYLYSEQGSAYDNFKGTCGLCSCANILRLAGVNYGEKEMIDYAVNPQGDLFSPKLCTVNPFNASASGGTTPKQRQQILDYFGVSSSIWNIKTDADGKVSLETINDICKWISEGRGVIIDVDAGLFYNSPVNYGKGHAVTITSVEKNKYGDVTAFYILDSNNGTVKCSSLEMQEMIRTFVGINVTSQIIR